MSIFTERLKKLRKDKGATQKDIANMLGLAERTYREYEAGGIDPPTSKAMKLAEYYGVSVDYLMGATENPTRL